MAQQLQFDLNVDNKAAISAINTFFDAFDAGAKNAAGQLDKAFGEKNKVIGITLEGGKVIAKEFNNISSIGNKVAKAAQVINGEFGKTPREIANSIRVLREMISNTEKTKKGTGRLTEEWKKLNQLLKDAKREAKKLTLDDGMTKSITGANIAAGLALQSINSLANGVKNLVQQGIDMEVLMIQLKGFTGGVEQAEAAFDEFVRIALSTPFNVKQVAEGAKVMMGFGVSTDDAIHRIEQLAIVASATGGELNHMARNLGQIQANQRAYTRDLMQFANQGIPIYQMLGEVLGMSTAQIRKLAEEGQIGFAEVSAALDKMTEKGSAFRQIADEMDKTIAARLEAIGSAITVTSGKFINMIQQVDKSLGGPLEKSFAAVIAVINGVGKSFDFVAKNANALRPIFAALIVAIGATFGIALVQNLAAIKNSLIALKATLMAYHSVQLLVNTAQAVFAALTGNWAAIAAAAAVAAGAVAIFASNTGDANKEQEELNRKIDEEKAVINGATNAAKLHAFQLEKISGKYKTTVQTAKELFNENQKGYNLAMASAERALKFIEMQAEKEIGLHQQKIERLNEAIEIEKQGMKDALDAAKTAHDEKMEGLNEELAAVRSRYDEELALLNEESQFAKELREIKRQEIQEKLRSGDLSRKETLELQEQLLQMDRAVKRRELLKNKKKEEEEILARIKAAEEENEKTVERITKEYEERIKALENNKKTEEEAIKEINAELAAQRQKVKDAKAEELAAIYKNKQAAIESLNEQIAKAEQLRIKMVKAYEAAKRAQTAARATGNTGGSGSSPGSGTLSARASGGPVLGGSSYRVNELGQEAFLSAAGHLSMINAPAWGKWTAPGAGTVIPAHLTKQLDIPNAGVKVNKNVSTSAAQHGGGMNRVVRAIQAGMAGDTFNQSVTVQSSNPTATANSMMVNMMRSRAMRSR